MVWQCNLRVWHWPWHNKEKHSISGSEYYSNFAGVGPFQFHWFSVPLKIVLDK